MSRPQARWLPNPDCCDTDDPRDLCGDCAARVAAVLNAVTDRFAREAGPAANAGFRPGGPAADDVLDLPTWEDDPAPRKAGRAAPGPADLPVANAAEVANAAGDDRLIFPEYGW